jgi:hypothetical protein
MTRMALLACKTTGSQNLYGRPSRVRSSAAENAFTRQAVATMTATPT